MQKKENPKKIETNIKKLLNKCVVYKDRVTEFEELSTLLKKSRQFIINEFWRLQTNVPILHLSISSGELVGWILYLADIGEVRHGMADVYYKGIISSSLNAKDNTPFASVVNTETDTIVIISLGGYASLIKPKIY